MPAKYIKDPAEMLELFNRYKVKIKNDPFVVVDYVGKDATPVDRRKEKPLTMEGFENFVADQPGKPWSLTDYFYNNHNEYANFSSICSRIKREIREDQIGGGMSGMFNASITQRLNGLVERTEVKTIKEQPLFSDDDSDA